MAIKIDVPGVGEVTVEGIAQEDTMQELLAAIRKSDKTKRKEENAIAKLKAAEAKAARELNNELDHTINEVDELGKSSKKSSKTVEEAFGDVGIVSKKTGKDLAWFGGSLVATAASVAVKMITEYDDMAKEPIKSSAQLLSTGIDIITQASKLGVNAVGGVASGVAGMVPLIGSGMQKLGEATTAAAVGLLDFAANLAKLANTVMAAEFEKVVASMKQMTAAGASFAGGMKEMYDLANDSGLGLSTFTSVVSSSREEIAKMGLSASEGAKIMSSGLNALNANSGQLRTQLLTLGYTFEEQGGIMATFFAREQASGRLREMSDSEVRRGTLDYAKNLKILSDLTGKDARELQKKALDESKRGALINKLTGEQRQAFMDSYSALERFGPGVQAALVQLQAGEFISDPTIAAQTELVEMLQGLSAGISSGNKNMVTITTDAMATTAEKIRNSGDAFSSAIDIALIAGVSGAAADIAKVRNQIIGYMLDPGQAEKAKKAAEDQMASTNQINKNFAELTNTSQKLQVEMENLANSFMPGYTTLLEETQKATVKALTDAIDIATNKKSINEVFGSDDLNKSLNKEKSPDSWIGALAGTAKADSGLTVGESWSKKLGFAKGGISTGPVSGYHATLHGTEAVVPLPDNKSIPVKLDSSALTESMANQTGILHNILVSVQKNNQIASQILQGTQ